MKSAVAWSLRVALAALFLYAGCGKLLDIQRFAMDVQNFRLTPWSVSVAIAFYLPWLEIFAALGLLLNRLYLGALATLAALSVVFAAALISAWARGLDIECGCLGRGGQTTVIEALLRVGGILIALAILAFSTKSARREIRPSDSAALQ